MRISQKLNAHGRTPLRVGNTPIELKEMHKSKLKIKGLRELFRNTQHYEPQISAYLENHAYETYEAFHNNPCPALHLELGESGMPKLTLGKLRRPTKNSVFLDYIVTLEHEFQVPKGIDEKEVFSAEEKSLGRDLAWIINCYIKKDGVMRE